MYIKHINIKSINYKGFTGSVNFDRKIKLYKGLVIINSNKLEYTGKSFFEVNTNFMAVIDKHTKQD